MRTILVVDDDPVSVRLVEMIAERNGYACVRASSAAEALACLDGSTVVEMVITDQNMDGMTGLEFFSKVRADVRFRHLPFILCTGQASRATVDEAMRLGIRHFIVKPITPKVVTEKVAAVEAERPRVMDSKASIMARLLLTDLEYKSLIVTSRQRIIGLRDELDAAYRGGDRVTTLMVAGRFREVAGLLGAARLLGAVEVLGGTQTWNDTEEAVALLFMDIAALESALEVEAKPQVMGRLIGY
ncbi:MAG TPA: response regulator [Candidatus Limnocylindrales bacterium]